MDWFRLFKNKGITEESSEPVSEALANSDFSRGAATAEFVSERSSELPAKPHDVPTVNSPTSTATVVALSETLSDGLLEYLNVTSSGGQQAQVNENGSSFEHKAANNDFSPLSIRYRAEKGEPESQYHLALAYEKGNGIDWSEADAFKWCRTAAEQGYAEAQYQLGLYYARGVGVPKNHDEKFMWFHKAAEQGVLPAQFEVGCCYQYGHGIEKNLDEALSWFDRCREQGFLNVEDNLRDVEVELKAWAEEKITNDSSAGRIKWCRTQAARGNLEIGYNLGLLYFDARVTPSKLKLSVGLMRWASLSGYDPATEFLDNIKRSNTKEANDLRYLINHTSNGKRIVQEMARDGNSTARCLLRGDFAACEQVSDSCVGENFCIAVKWLLEGLDLTLPQDQKPAWKLQAALGDLNGRYNLARIDAEQGIVGRFVDIINGYLDNENDFAGVVTANELVSQCRELLRMGYVDVQLPLAKLLLRVNQDINEAIDFLSLLAKNGSNEAQKILAEQYYYGDQAAKDFKSAAVWFRMSGAKNKKIEFGLGEYFANQKQSAESEFWFLRAKENGHPEAEKRLILIKAEIGKSEDQYSLALAYANGTSGYVQDYAKAVEWHRKAAEQGHDGAQCYLGWCYDQGKGAAQDYGEAVKWFRKSADQGSATAQSNLGLYYRFGRGVQKDLFEAIRWFEKAVALGNEVAKKHLVAAREELEKQAEEKLRAEKAARRKLGFDGEFFRAGSQIAEWIASLDVTGNSVKWAFAATLGDGPFAVEMMDAILNRQRVTPCYCGDEHAPVLIVGRTGWTEDEMDKHIAARSGQSLHIYSQEMAMVSLLTGHDPFDAGEDVLLEFGKGHPALEFLMQHAFTWPVVTQGWSGEIFIDGDAWRNKSPLTAMEYHVGHTSALTELARRNVLTKIYKGRLIFPAGFSPAEQKEWGMPGSGTRLEKIATHIARQISLRISRPEYHVAVREWQSDLSWLKQQFYQKSYRFGWPS